jgi:DHA1 family bicyclomycin/chloramphenicol resistance-like MFS transporter
VRYGVRRAVAVAGALSLSGGAVMAALALAGVQSAWAIELPFCLFMLGHGIHNPCGQSGAVGPFPQAAGAASALNGFISMVFAFGTGQWLGTHMDGTAVPLIYGILFWTVMIALSAWTLVQRYGRP